jgi:hypothetical protein
MQYLFGLWKHIILADKQTFKSLQKRGFITDKYASKPELPNASSTVLPH